MCGIAGIVSLTGGSLKHPETVRRMMDKLAHRGPDEEGFYLNRPATVALGHRRLRIIDLSTGQQPMANADGSVWISFNGEIYGFKALREQLLARGYQFRSRTDTEVILHLYEQEGVGCLKQLTGMFAFALWDEAAKTLLLARDRMGKKPLYYAIADGTLAFASELGALVAGTTVSRDIDELALDQYLTLGYIPAPRTIYRAVKKLEAGQYLLTTGSQPVAHWYWKPEVRQPLRPAYTWDEAKQELLERLRVSTALRMVSDVPIGCFLSGGVDSSTVLSFMAELSSRPVKTFSIGFPEAEYSELPYARIVARHYGTDHHEFVLEPQGIEVLDRLVSHFGEPFADSSALPTWYLSQLTRKSVTVALSGDGGDELFGGYDWYRTARFLEAASAMPTWLARGTAWLAGVPGPRVLRRVGKAAQLVTLPAGARHATLREIVAAHIKAQLYTPEFRMQTGDQALDWLARRHDSLAATDPLNQMMATDLATYMADDLLVKVDRTTMAHALECRSPLLDSTLVEWVLSLPSSFKLRAGSLSQAWRPAGLEGKTLLREAVKNRFPRGFLDRPKRGFSVPLERWFQNDLRTIVTDRVLHGPLSGLGLLQPAAMQRLVQEHFEGQANHAALVWGLLVLATWMAQSMEAS
jgi:asparagine synthase (glutamine-hydrolysing)